MTPVSNRKPRRPLDDQGLQTLALRYVGRYATTKAKLRAYLLRKVKERGWQGDEAPPVAALVERFVLLGYVDDAAFASARAASLQRRGYGERRIAQALGAAGIDEDILGSVREQVSEQAFASALRFAQRKRIGPFAVEKPDRIGRGKAFAAMVRAGHPSHIVRKLVEMAPGDVPDRDGI